MTGDAELIAGLDRAAELLLTPHAGAMQECRATLEKAVALAQDEPLRVQAPGVKRAIRNIRFLLEQARAFWNARSNKAASGLQYSSRGALVPSSQPSTFAIEV